MTKNIKHIRKLIFTITTMAFVCMAFIFGVFMNSSKVSAYVQKDNNLSNLNFSANKNTTEVYSSPTGWTKGFADSNATSGVINLDKFASGNFQLTADQNPHKLSDSADDYVLMINSKNSTENLPKVQYYTNNSSLSLKSNSSYKIVVWTKVLANTKASIYITGLEDEMSFENISYSEASEWTAYTFYISTGIDSQSIKTELWLGSKNPNKTSTGAVFFDNIEIYQISENEIPESLNSYTKYLNYNESTLISGINSDFENIQLTGWTPVSSQMELGTHAEVINQSNNNVSNAKGISYLGTDLSRNNTNSLVLYTDNEVKSYFGYKSESINISANEIVKVSVSAKVADLNGGSAYVKLVENNILNLDGEPLDYITPASNQITLSSNITNKFTNDYNICNFYVKGRSLYNSSFNIELWLGSEENPTSGVVSFDNLKIEPISYEQYSNVSTGSTDVKVELQTNSTSYNISNADFNETQKAEKELTYPLIPANWSHKSGNEENVYFGVINTNADIYNATVNQFGNFTANPGNPEGFLSSDKDTNNVLLMYNIDTTYQNAKSNHFEVSSNKFYKLAFDYKLIATSAQTELLNIYVIDDANNVLYSDEDITNNNAWEKYELNISTNSYTNKLNLIISLGTEEKQVKGLLYVDNVEIKENTTMTSETFTEIAQTSNVLDFQEGNFNLVKDNGTSLYTPLRYQGALEVGTNPEIGNAIAEAGAVDGNNTMSEYGITNSPNNSNALKYMLMIQTHDNATYSLTAKDTFNLETNKSYKFTVDVITKGLNNPNNEEGTIGAEFALSGLEQNIKGIIANDWTTYTIYVKCTTATEVSLRFALSSLSVDTSGIVFFDNFTYSEVENDVFGTEQVEHKENNTYLFIGDTDVKDEDSSNTSGFSTEYLWLVVPSLIFAVALILAVIVFFMKKLKIKKWEKKKVNEYDREKTVHRDVIRVEAEKARDASIKEIKEQIAELEKESTRLKEIHQEQAKQNKQSREKGISRASEKEFKHYAKLHTALENRIASLNKQIEDMNTPEYLLAVQHKIAVEKAKQERLKKESELKKKK